jgi:hypothetical protein
VSVQKNENKFELDTLAGQNNWIAAANAQHGKTF